MHWLRFGVCTLFALVLAMAIPNPPAHREPIDGLRAIGVFRRVVAVSTNSNDSAFKCLSAIRTRYVPEEREATFVWNFKGHGGTAKKKLTFDIKFGNVSDQPTFFINKDYTRSFTAYYNYSDYENCLLAVIPTHDHEHCILWVKRSVAHAIPQNCLDHYEETCDVRVPQFDNDLCKDDE
ncbi:uncharacterized protein LOC144149443 [Haemaphysalis longicornis]